MTILSARGVASRPSQCAYHGQTVPPFHITSSNGSKACPRRYGAQPVLASVSSGQPAATATTTTPAQMAPYLPRSTGQVNGSFGAATDVKKAAQLLSVAQNFVTACLRLMVHADAVDINNVIQQSAPDIRLLPDGLARCEPAQGIHALLSVLKAHREQYGGAMLEQPNLVTSAVGDAGVVYFLHSFCLKDVGGSPGHPATFRVSRGHSVSAVQVDSSGRVAQLWLRRPMTHEEREALLRDPVHCYPAVFPLDNVRRRQAAEDSTKHASRLVSIAAWAAAHSQGGGRLEGVLTPQCRLLDAYGITAPAVRPSAGRRRYLEGPSEISAALQLVHAKYRTECELVHSALAEDCNVGFCHWRARLAPRSAPQPPAEVVAQGAAVASVHERQQGAAEVFGKRSPSSMPMDTTFPMAAASVKPAGATDVAVAKNEAAAAKTPAAAATSTEADTRAAAGGAVDSAPAMPSQQQWHQNHPIFEGPASLLRNIPALPNLPHLPEVHLPEVHLPDVRQLLEDAMSRLPTLLPLDEEDVDPAVVAAEAAAAANLPHEVEGIDVLLFNSEGLVCDVWSLRQPLGCEREVLFPRAVGQMSGSKDLGER